MVPIQSKQRKVDKTLSKLDMEMYKLLHKGIDDDCEKAKLYSNSLSNHLKSLRPNIATDKFLAVVEQDDPTETLESMVMDTVPKTWKSRATRLLKHLQSIPDVSWNDRFELVLKKHVVAKTHLVDLVNDLLRKRATIAAPAGWKQLANALKEYNIPRELIGNEDRWKYINDASEESPTVTRKRRTSSRKPAIPSARKRTTPTATIYKPKRPKIVWEQLY